MSAAQDLMPLAQSFRAMLATPHNTIAGDRLRAMMRRDPGPVRRARMLMDTSHRYLLEDDFTEAAARASMLEPRTLLKAIASCRMPFDTMWIEWNDTVRRRHAIDGSEFAHAPDFMAGLPARRGILISTVSKQPDIQVIHLQPVYGPFTSDPATMARLPSCIMGEVGQELFLLEGGQSYGQQLLDLLKDASSLSARAFGSGIGRREMDEFYQSIGHTRKPDRDLSDPNSGYDEWTTEVAPTPIGFAYTSRFRPRYPDEVAHLVARTAVVSNLFHKDPEGSVIPNVIWECLLDPERHEDIQQDMFLPSGDARFVIAVLALLSDNAVTTLRMATTGETGTMWRDGKQLPKYEYQIVNLVRPAEERVIELDRAILASEPWNGVRYHAVEGHWCYSHRHGRDTCRHGDWTRRVDDEGAPKGQDMWKCGGCGKFRWWRNPHHRGNPEIGVVEKGYDVNAGMALH